MKYRFTRKQIYNELIDIRCDPNTANKLSILAGKLICHQHAPYVGQEFVGYNSLTEPIPYSTLPTSNAYLASKEGEKMTGEEVRNELGNILRNIFFSNSGDDYSEYLSEQDDVEEIIDLLGDYFYEKFTNSNQK